jgi:hypothetical protein
METVNIFIVSVEIHAWGEEGYSQRFKSIKCYGRS